MRWRSDKPGYFYLSTPAITARASACVPPDSSAADGRTCSCKWLVPSLTYCWERCRCRYLCKGEAQKRKEETHPGVGIPVGMLTRTLSVHCSTITRLSRSLLNRDLTSLLKITHSGSISTGIRRVRFSTTLNESHEQGYFLPTKKQTSRGVDGVLTPSL
uniref:HTH_Tnp_IS1 domain-containing protein n=1 Tax=Steinernema glaseri TaxID=37863 RepID=A0A1I8A615_9BILA